MADAKPASRKKATAPPKTVLTSTANRNGFSNQVKGWMDRVTAKSRALEGENKRLKQERTALLAFCKEVGRHAERIETDAKSHRGNSGGNSFGESPS